MNYSVLDIKTVETEGKGYLSFFESRHDIPFDIKRVYYIYATPESEERGGHAHYSLQQLLWCPFGRIEIVLDDGNNRESVMLDNPSKGLLLGELIWREMIWHEAGSVLTVAASDYYNESDYIRNYDSFLAALRDNGADEQ